MNNFENYLKRRIDNEDKFENLLKFPKYVEIETVNACNARCPMCTINDWERNYPIMKDEVFNKVSDDIIENKKHIKRVSLYRDGEPLIDKKMAKRINKFYKNGILNTSIATNVALLNEKRATDLLEAGLGMIIFSIDSLIKEVYEGSLIQKQNINATYNFSEYNPIIVENVIEDSAITIFKDYYREAISKGYFVLGDNQSNRYKSNNEAFSRFLHYEILPLIEKIVCKKLKPTYSYLSAYTKNADLPPHTDRPDCEYTVSFIVDKPNNESWPIYFDKTKQPIKGKGRYDTKPLKEECIDCDCESNGLMIFNGRDHIHYREALEHDFYNILLLHYKGYND